MDNLLLDTSRWNHIPSWFSLVLDAAKIVGHRDNLGN